MENYIDHEAEKTLLATLFLFPEKIHQVMGFGIDDSDFHHPKYRMLMSAMIDLSQREKEISPLSVSNWSEKNGSYISCAELLDLMNHSIGSSLLETDMHVVKERSQVRKILAIGGKLPPIAKTYLDQPEEAINLLEKEILSISKANKVKGFESVQSSIKKLLKELNEEKGQLSGLTTGFPALDSYLNGLRPGQMIVLAARPSVGKTSLALNMCQNIMRENNVPVGIVSLEMPTSELTCKLLASEGEISLRTLQTKDFKGDHEIRRLGAAVKFFSDHQLFIDDQAGQTIHQIRTGLRNIKMSHGLSFACIDYLGLIQPHSRYANKADQIGEISMTIKAMAKELEIPILVLAQLNRDAEKADGSGKRPRPALHNLRDSGSIEQDADVVMFIDRDKNINPTEATLIIAKNRAGELGDVPLSFIGQFSTFTSR